MPRKDRRFTPEDVARFYCKQMSERQKGLVLALMQTCGSEMTDNEVLAELIRYVADFCDTINLPGMHLISTALRFLAIGVETERTEQDIQNYLSSGDVLGVGS